ncbi:efflux RND transporter permease subunit [Mariniblastus fucicola]|uniref:Nickel and cobalt resistance protein CnrA n=1 Tax=Mariniblastus fucicola TaxID=980251 RepID=A0A5B9PJ95_9BACT|nr:efflux RND transporter permease subunit [Mariniblastus fucicola]QEG24726.1 Nickel and cobalt resistance protein CnrA [Mariniblastus fucicola]
MNSPPGSNRSTDPPLHWSTVGIRKPRLLIMMIALLLVGGLSSYMILPRMEDPVLTARAATISTRFPVADAAQVEALVTDRIEKAIREVEQIKEIRSQSRSGASLITVELRDDVYEPGPIWSRIRGKVEDSIAFLPAEASRPQFDEIDVRAFAWIGALTWAQDSEPNYAILGRFAKDLEDRIRAISGTDDVSQFGKPDEEIVVEVDQSRLANVGLSAVDVADSIRGDDARNAAGTLRSDNESIAVEMANQLNSVEAIRQLPLKNSGEQGNFVVIGDVAKVERTIADPPAELGQMNGQAAMLLGAMVRNRSRIDTWRAELGDVVDGFRAELPPAIELVDVLDQNQYVQGRLSELLGNLAIGSLAVLCVVWLLMGWRNALMVSMALPLVSLAVLSGMRINETPIHQMSVAGLIIALGLLIDNAIVIVDSVSSQIRSGKSHLQAVSATGRILAIPLLASTLTTAFAFAPICLMEGPAGEFVGAMAMNVVISVASSLLLSLLIIAPLAAMLDRIGTRDQTSAAGVRPGFLKPVFERIVLTSIRRPILTAAGCAALAAAGIVSMSMLPMQFFPPADRDQFHIEVELPPNASFAELKTLTNEISKELGNNPRVQQSTWLLGRTAPAFYYNIITNRLGAKNYAHGIVQLDSKKDGSAEIRKVQRDLQTRFPEARLLARQLEQGPPFTAPIELRFFGPNLDVLRELGEKSRKLLSGLEDVVHVRVELNDSTPTVQVDVSTEDAQLAGLRPGQIASQINAQLDGAVGGFVLQQTEQIPVRVRIAGHQRANFEDLNQLSLVFPSADGPRQIPLSAVADLKLKPTTATVARLNSIRMQEVQVFLQAGTLPSKVQAKLQSKMKEVGWTLPPRYSMEFGGESSKRGEAVGNLMASVGILIAAMITTLVLSIGSFRGAVVIGAVAMMAVGFGGASLYLFGFPFGFMAIVGIMGLIGIAINDSIVVLTALREDEAASAGDEQAILRVTLHETRHVLATTFTTIAGFLPLILAGGGFWPPMAIAIAGGVVGCTLLALVFVPSSFGWLVRRKQASAESAPAMIRRPIEVFRQHSVT